MKRAIVFISVLVFFSSISFAEKYSGGTGEQNVLDTDFSDDADGLSDYDNFYLFTGRRVDILDNGSLKIQYNRNRYYSYNMGRWLTHDPLGVTPNPQRPNYSKITAQYTDGLNLYEYVKDNPSIYFDSFGCFTPAPCPLKLPLGVAEFIEIHGCSLSPPEYWDYEPCIWVETDRIVIGKRRFNTGTELDGQPCTYLDTSTFV